MYNQRGVDRTNRAIDQFRGRLPETQHLPLGVVCRWWVAVITGIGGDLPLSVAVMTMITRQPVLCFEH
jgi:hypothetical protein